MDEEPPRTAFVRRTVFGRNFGPDLPYVQDLLAMERLLSEAPPGLAGSMALRHLMSRYPAEADGIIHELGTPPFTPLEEARVASLLEERLRLAEGRHLLRPDQPDGRRRRFDF